MPGALAFRTGTMRYLDFLGQVHQRLAPPTYLEIGIRHGGSLSLSRSRSVGIDPAYKLRYDLPRDVALFRETSDAYFEREEPLEALDDAPIGFSFIDGLHLAEFALRDFMNVERHSAWTTAIVFDDILPRTVDEAARDRITDAWTGDVYKVLEVLERYRPDLICLRVGTQPTGLGLILGLDPASTVLADAYPQIEREIVTPDPQDVPEAVFAHRGVLDPQAVLDAPFWELLRELRAAGTPRAEGIERLRRAVAALSAPAAA
jgi:hypothetical protein